MDSLTEFASGSSVSTLTALAITSVFTLDPDEAPPVLAPVPVGVAGPLQAATTPTARAARPAPSVRAPSVRALSVRAPGIRALSIRDRVARDITAPLSSIVDNLALTLKMSRRGRQSFRCCPLHYFYWQMRRCPSPLACSPPGRDLDGTRRFKDNRRLSTT